MWKIPLACLLIFLHTPNPLSDFSLILWNLGVGKFQVVTRCFSHPGMARVFFFLIRIFFLMSNWLLLLPPALPLLLLRLHRLLHLLEAGKIFLFFKYSSSTSFPAHTFTPPPGVADFGLAGLTRAHTPFGPHPPRVAGKLFATLRKLFEKHGIAKKKVFASTMWKNL